MRSFRHPFTLGVIAFAMAMPQPVLADTVDFGDDTGRYAKDGECDDQRFSGTGMTSTLLLEEDIRRDATDCKAAFDARTIILRGSQPRLPTESIQWGDDSAQWANDNECDDIRFVGSRMAEAQLIESIGKDASDCRTAYEGERIDFNPLFLTPADEKLIDFGDDASSFANNEQCDDIRFTGEYAPEMIYLAEDIGHDASDCKAAFDAGTAVWQADKVPMNLGAYLSEKAEEG